MTVLFYPLHLALLKWILCSALSDYVAGKCIAMISEKNGILKIFYTNHGLSDLH